MPAVVFAVDAAMSIWWFVVDDPKEELATAPITNPTVHAAAATALVLRRH
jgi:hypothetical protein